MLTTGPRKATRPAWPPRRLDPLIARDWDPIANDRTLASIKAGADYEAHWKCHRCACDWVAPVSRRTIRQTRCERCSTERADGQNSLAALHPTLVQEWDIVRNGALRPDRQGNLRQGRRMDRFYTEKLGFEKKTDIPMGEHRWLTVVAPEDRDGVELVLEPDSHPAADPFKAALVADGIPYTSFAVTDARREFERLRDAGVRFVQEPTEMGPVTTAVLDDTCGT